MIFTAILVNFVELITIWGFLGVGIPPFLNTLVGGVDVLEGHNGVLGVIGKVTWLWNSISKVRSARSLGTIMAADRRVRRFGFEN